MKQRTRNIILIIVALQFILIIGLLTLPSVVQAIPGRYRVALSERAPLLSDITEGVMDAVAPVATALPAPAQEHKGAKVDIGALIVAEAATMEPTVAGQPDSAEPPAVVEPGTNEPEANVTAEPALIPTATPMPAPTPTLAPLPSQHTLNGMSTIQQTFNNCGPANLTQTLNFLGNEITQTEVADYLKPNPEDRNVSPWQIADYVNEQTPGYSAIARSGGTLEMIKRFVTAGYPVVIEKGYELPDSGWWGHYLTVFGYDDDKQELYTQDSYLGPFDGSGRAASYGEIEEYRQQFNYTFYLVYLPEQESFCTMGFGRRY